MLLSILLSNSDSSCYTKEQIWGNAWGLTFFAFSSEYSIENLSARLVRLPLSKALNNKFRYLLTSCDSAVFGSLCDLLYSTRS